MKPLLPPGEPRAWTHAARALLRAPGPAAARILAHLPPPIGTAAA